ncbi:glycosyltransferase family 4 protein [Dyadobacter sediminis]|uniref:Glycosyltransferase family 4 protein n=1 Tax=Dyadobacter sediminis TaxID=1493691 RepID=A0A5R9KIS2_9BACT|nr:glycosyltransferase family 4 protein [Dyadobacter sediminis]TLU96123.1 glycosyltransferase family 4 protein [Dyadobacter sediminis]GGB79460.1 glycosyl transferase [Dyadobacter sediminis]
MGAADHPSPLKILMTADTVGGVWTYTMDLCKALSGYNIHFHLVTLGARMQEWQQKEVSELSNVIVYETDFQLEWMEDPWEDISSSEAYLLALQKAVQADIIHLNGYVYGSLNWEAPVLIVAHSDVYSWWRAVKKQNPPAACNTYFAKVRNGLLHANHIVAPSQAMISEINDIYNLRQSHSVIYNARNASHLHAAEKDGTVMCMGRIWDEAKNVQLLMQASSNLHHPVKIAGDNHFQHNMLDFSESKVRNLGKLSSVHIARELSTASIYALPAKYEPFGLSVLEAALSGCALVLGNIPSLREIWQDNAVFVDTDDADELARAINHLMNDQHELESMASKAQNHAKQFSTHRMATQYMDLYRQLLQEYNQPVLEKNTLK